MYYRCHFKHRRPTMDKSMPRINSVEAIKSFYVNWRKAFNDGWKLMNGLIAPPSDHEACCWSAHWYQTKSGLLVPHWFPDYYTISDEEYLLEIDEPLEIQMLAENPENLESILMVKADFPENSIQTVKSTENTIINSFPLETLIDTLSITELMYLILKKIYHNIPFWRKK